MEAAGMLPRRGNAGTRWLCRRQPALSSAKVVRLRGIRADVFPKAEDAAEVMERQVDEHQEVFRGNTDVFPMVTGLPENLINMLDIQISFDDCVKHGFWTAWGDGTHSWQQ